MNARSDFYHLYSVLAENGDWQAAVPEWKLAEEVGQLFNDRTGLRYSIRDEGMRNPLNFEEHGSPSLLPAFWVVGTLNDKGQFDRWLGAFANELDAKRYYGYSNAVLPDICDFFKIKPGRGR